MLNLAIHNIISVELTDTRTVVGAAHTFSSRALAVRYRDALGEMRTQSIDLFADEAASLSVLMQEEVTA